MTYPTLLLSKADIKYGHCIDHVLMIQDITVTVSTFAVITAFLSHRDQDPGPNLEHEMGQYPVRKADPGPERKVDPDPEEKTDPDPEREAGLDPEIDLGTEDGTDPGREATMPGNCPKHNTHLHVLHILFSFFFLNEKSVKCILLAVPVFA